MHIHVIIFSFSFFVTRLELCLHVNFLRTHTAQASFILLRKYNVFPAVCVYARPQNTAQNLFIQMNRLFFILCMFIAHVSLLSLLSGTGIHIFSILVVASSPLRVPVYSMSSCSCVPVSNYKIKETN